VQAEMMNGSVLTSRGTVISGYYTVPWAFKIIEIKNENDTTKTFVLDAKLAAEPGQFVMVWLPGLEDKPFSLADVDPIKLTIAAVGPFSRSLHQLKVGDLLWVRGPLGRGYTLPEISGPDDLGGRLVLVGGGYGVAPLYFLTCQALSAGFEVSMIIGARRANGLLLVNDFKALAVDLWLTTEDGSMGLQGLVTDALQKIITESETQPVAVYACGPTGMLDAVGARCEAEGIAVQLSWEAHMRCGLGLCGSCEVGQGWLTCLDGPVFPFNPLTSNP